MSDKLTQLRKQIDEIDRTILHLLKQRMQCVVDIAQAKQKLGKAVFDPEREEKLFRSLLEEAQKKDIPEGLVRKLWTAIIIASRKKQREEVARGTKLYTQLFNKIRIMRRS